MKRQTTRLEIVLSIMVLLFASLLALCAWHDYAQAAQVASYETPDPDPEPDPDPSPQSSPSPDPEPAADVDAPDPDGDSPNQERCEGRGWRSSVRFWKPHTDPCPPLRKPETE